jgi:hypothetical protein
MKLLIIIIVAMLAGLYPLAWLINISTGMTFFAALFFAGMVEIILFLCYVIFELVYYP